MKKNLSSISTIKRLVKRDIKMSFIPFMFKMIPFYLVYILYNVLFISSQRGYEIIDVKNTVFNIYKGCEYITNLANQNLNSGFQFPIFWLLINAYILYVVGDYISNDMKKNGKYVLIRVGKIQYIYISKVIWASIAIIIYYSSLLVITCILANLNYSGIYKIMSEHYNKIGSIELIAQVFIVFSLTSIAVSVIFTAVSFKIKSLYAFLVSIVLYAASVFVESKAFIGQHSIILRHTPFEYAHNFTMLDSVLFTGITFICFFIIGYKIIIKTDIF